MAYREIFELVLIPGAVDQLQSAICCSRQNIVWVAASSLLLCEEKSLYSTDLPNVKYLRSLALIAATAVVVKHFKPVA